MPLFLVLSALLGGAQENHIMLGATISVYINQQFTWTLSKDPFGAHPRL